MKVDSKISNGAVMGYHRKVNCFKICLAKTDQENAFQRAKLVQIRRFSIRVYQNATEDRKSVV